MFFRCPVEKTGVGVTETRRTNPGPSVSYQRCVVPDRSALPQSNAWGELPVDYYDPHEVSRELREKEEGLEATIELLPGEMDPSNIQLNYSKGQSLHGGV